MNVFILHNKTKEGSYAEALFHLLVLFFQKQGFTFLINYDVNELRETETGRQDTVLILHTGKKALPFFTRLSLKSISKKKGFDYFIQIADSELVSSKLPQHIISNDIRIPYTHTHLSRVSFAVCSKAEKQKVSEQNESRSDLIRIIPPAAEDIYRPVSWSEQQALKMQYTQGREYFFVFAEGKTIHCFTELLKAFSTFKKWQHSSMKLIIAGTLSFTGTNEWKEKISTYRFREDVVLLGETHTKESIQIFAGAYAFIHFPAAENDLLPLLRAMQCETPCLTFATDSIVEYADDSAVVIEQNNYNHLSEKMILLYKDEALRSRLISKGKERANLYTKEKTFAAFTEAFSLSAH